MKMVETQINRLDIAHCTAKHAEFSIYEDCARNCIVMLARTKPVRSLQIHVEDKIQIEPCEWTKHWWAKAVIWLEKRMRWAVPKSLVAFASATHVTYQREVIQLRESVTDNIQAQCAALLAEGKTPERILIGKDIPAMFLEGMHASQYRPMLHKRMNSVSIMGIPAEFCERLENDAVLVIAKLNE